ncbi:hypothetical protein ACFL2J_07550 [Candidatus Omnitrophota bacterium]
MKKLLVLLVAAVLFLGSMNVFAEQGKYHGPKSTSGDCVPDLGPRE